MRAIAFLREWLKEPQGKNPAAEVSPVESLAENNFANLLKLPQRKFLGK